MDVNKKYDPATLLDLSLWYDDTVVTCVYYEGSKGWTMVKRFMIETNSLDQDFKFISEASGSKLYFATLEENPVVRFSYKKDRVKREEVLHLNDFVDVKGWKALGNKLGDYKILKIEEAGDHTDPDVEIITDEIETSGKKSRPKKAATAAKDKKQPTKKSTTKRKSTKKGDKLNPGDTIEFDF